MKIVISSNKTYNSKMILSPHRLKDMIKESYNDYEFVEFLWAHLSNNPNIVVGLLDIVNDDKYCFHYRFLGNPELYSHTYTLGEVFTNVRRRCECFGRTI
jgi:hypothetical protein